METHRHHFFFFFSHKYKTEMFKAWRDTGQHLIQTAGDKSLQISCRIVFKCELCAFSGGSHVNLKRFWKASRTHKGPPFSFYRLESWDSTWWSVESSWFFPEPGFEHRFLENHSVVYSFWVFCRQLAVRLLDQNLNLTFFFFFFVNTTYFIYLWKD